MCDDSEDDHDLRHEGERVLKEIAPHVKAAESSAYLESSYTVTHLNIKTKEDAALCVRLTVRGYEVVGDEFDRADKIPEKCYELIDQLLNDLSPAYRQSFSDSLNEKLTALAKQ